MDNDEDINGELTYSIVTGSRGKFTIEGKKLLTFQTRNKTKTFLPNFTLLLVTLAVKNGVKMELRKYIACCRKMF